MIELAYWHTAYWQSDHFEDATIVPVLVKKTFVHVEEIPATEQRTGSCHFGQLKLFMQICRILAQAAAAVSQHRQRSSQAGLKMPWCCELERDTPVMKRGTGQTCV